MIFIYMNHVQLYYSFSGKLYALTLRSYIIKKVYFLWIDGL